MRITIDAGLKPQIRPFATFDAFQKELVTGSAWSKTLPAGLEYVSTDLDPTRGVYHRDLFEAMEEAWRNHYGITLTPDTLWFTLLSQLAAMVKLSPERFKAQFTRSDEAKTTISVPTGDGTKLPIDAVIARLQTLSPMDPNVFFPSFSTTTPVAQLAFMAAFLDLASPFYNYSTFCCGIPFVDLLGTKEDWRLIEQRWSLLGETLGTSGVWAGYFATVEKHLGKIVDQFDAPDPAFWAKMFYMERCGSGSQVEAFGWYTDLVFEQPQGPRFPGNFPSQLATINYHSLSLRQDFVAYYGLLSSHLAEDVLVPQFGHLVYQKTA